MEEMDRIKALFAKHNIPVAGGCRTGDSTGAIAPYSDRGYPYRLWVVDFVRNGNAGSTFVEIPRNPYWSIQVGGLDTEVYPDWDKRLFG